MTDDQFEALVKGLESSARANPGGYRTKVRLLAALGYGYILSVLGLLVLLLATGVWIMIWGHHVNALLIKFEIFIAVLVYLVGTALWVRFDLPQGVELARGDHPRLFAMLDDVSDKLQAPRFDHVLLDHDFNCGVLQWPRLGPLGWFRNYLILGLPLMTALSAEEFRAVIAHEFGHLSGNHSKFSGWTYRVRRTWGQLLENFERHENKGSWLFMTFLRWYVPYFSAYTFVLAREDEYVADKCAVDVSGAATAARTLMMVQVKSHISDEHWLELTKLIKVQETPPKRFITDLCEALQGMPAPDVCGRWVKKSLRARTDYDDTHPSLTDRLTAIGAPTAADLCAADLAAATTQPRVSAAEDFLNNLPALTETLDMLWTVMSSAGWSAGHLEAAHARVRLEQLEKKSATGPLAEDEMMERVGLIVDTMDPEPALAMLRSDVERHGETAILCLGLGQVLAAQSDESGLAWLDKARALDERAVVPAFQAAWEFLIDADRDEEAEQYRKNVIEQIERSAAPGA